MNTVIQVVCSLCGKYIGSKPGEGVEGISHSTCEECLRENSDIFTEEEIQELIINQRRLYGP
jgi:hypothetical protein